MNSKDKGDISEAKVLADLLAKGKKVLVPWGDNLSYDLVIDDDGVFKRIQVKHGRYSDGVIVANTCHSMNRGSRKDKNRDYCGEVEFIAIYSSYLDEVFYVPIEDCNSFAVCLRIEEPQRNMNTIKWAKDYKEIY